MVELFLRFIDGIGRASAQPAQALYLLGDLFEYWIGDDDAKDVVGWRVLDALATLTERNVAVAFIAGNRDFLLGKRAARHARMRVLADPTVIDLFGRPALLTHGDTLCTDDVAYQAYRRRIRNPLAVKTLRVLPLSVRHRIARGLRHRSESEKRDKPAAIIDVNAGAVAQAFESYAVDLMIHGHTHRPAHHTLSLGGRARDRFVLADWHEHGSYLRVSGSRNESIEAISFE
jgi:UDP-2,3-diacylglucosamine hydrolase